MNHNLEEWLIASICCDAAPEFRANQPLFSEAYSGPEQRRQLDLGLKKLPRRRKMLVMETKLPETALAA